MPLSLPIRLIRRPVFPGVDETSFHRVEVGVDLSIGHSALVLVDVWDSHHIASHQKRCQRVIDEAIAPLVAAARQAGMPVLHAPGPEVAAHYPQCQTFGKPGQARWLGQLPASEQHRDSGSKSEPPGWPKPEVPPPDVIRLRADRRIAPQVTPLYSEPVVADFEQLMAALALTGASVLFYAGFAANICLPFRDYGMRAAQAAGYKVVLVRDATTAVEFDETLDSQLLLEAAIADIEMNYGATTTASHLTEALLSTYRANPQATG